MVSIEDGLELIYQESRPKANELIPIEKSLNRVISRNIQAKYPLPNFDNSAMDGYGVSIVDVGKRVKIEKTIFAGDEVEGVELSAGSCFKIMTGAKIPKGVNSIIPFEDVESPVDEYIQLPNSIKPNNHIRKAGEDIQIGETIIQKGERITPYTIGLLASQGISHIEVFRKPKIVVFATGKELKMHYETIAPHQIYNSNSPMIVAKSESLGADVSFVNIASDSKEEIKRAIQNSLYADMIVTSGGVSVGEADKTKESFRELGMETIFEKVDIKPGKPTTFGKIGDTLVLNLPGNPSAGLINFEIFGKASILGLSGDREKELDVIDCEIGETLKVKPGKRTVVLGIFDGGVFRPLKKRAPGMVKPLAESNGFIILEKEVSKIEAGSFVKFIPTKFSWFSDFRKSLITYI